MWNIVNGSLAKPTSTAADYNAWVQADATACFVIMSVLDHLLLHLVNDDKLSLHKIWTKLMTNYSATSTLLAFTKLCAYFSHAVNSSQPLAQQLKERGRLWKEVQDSGILQSPELLQVFSLLIALPNTYNNIVEPILAVTKPADLKLDDVCNCLLDEAARKESPNGNVAAIRVNGNGASMSSDIKKKGKCHFCGHMGHLEAECNKKKKAMKEAREGKGSKDSGSTTGSTSIHAVSADGSTSKAANTATSFYLSGAMSWMIDSDCTRHMSPNLNKFAEYTLFASPSHATLADKAKTAVSTLGSGSIVVSTVVDRKSVLLRLESVLYSPSIEHRLLSIACLEAKGFSTVFSDRQACIICNGTTYGLGTCRSRQYWLTLIARASSIAASVHHATSINIVHRCFAHLNWEAIWKLRATDNSPVKGIAFDTESRSPHLCKGCIMGKHHRHSFPSLSTPCAALPFDLVHSDLDGPMSVTSMQGQKQYFATFIDDCTDITWAFPLVSKNKFLPKFKEFQALVTTQFSSKIKVF